MPDFLRILLAGLAAAALLLANPGWLQPLIIALGGLVGLALLRGKATPTTEEAPRAPGVLSSKRFAMTLLVVFALLLGTTFWLTSDNVWVKTFGIFYRTGALVFGGGHVVLPLLQAGTVDTGLVSHDRFLAGYGAAQALPGPLFAFSAFLGASISTSPILMGLWCLAAIYLPALLLAAGGLPFWSLLNASRPARAALLGANAVVVGLLVAVFISAIGQNHLLSLPTGLLGVVAFVILQGTKIPNWLVVIACALAGQIFL
ncbi:MAG: chromate transporter [Chthoniobacteraceae bacterium]